MTEAAVINLVGLGIAVLSNVIALVWAFARMSARIDVVLEKLETNKAENARNMSEAARDIERRVDSRFDSLAASVAHLDRRVAVLEERSHGI